MPAADRSGAGGSGGDEFDRIVERLDLDLSFPDDETAPNPGAADDEASRPWSRGPDADDEEEPFYRRVQPSERPWRRGTTLAMTALVGAPLTLVVCSLMAIIVPRAVLAALVLLFVAGAVYLIAQLPEHGPADRDGPDDGAVI